MTLGTRKSRVDVHMCETLREEEMMPSKIFAMVVFVSAPSAQRIALTA